MHCSVPSAGRDLHEVEVPRQEALLREYSEVASNFRLLTDIRFKLLAILPIAAVLAAAIKGTGAANARTAAATLGLGVFGAFVTAALMNYNARNDQLYNELVGRAADIERRAGLADGAFSHRPNAWFAIRLAGLRIPVNHGTSVSAIYGASMTLWLFLFFYSFAQLVAYHDKHHPAPWWILLGTVGASAIIVAAGHWMIAGQRRSRESDMRTAAVAAVDLAESYGLASCASSTVFLALCSGLLDRKLGSARKFRDLCHDLREGGQKELAQKELAHNTFKRCLSSRDDVLSGDVRRRADFYAAELTRTSTLYIPVLTAEPPTTRSCYFVALIADVPPRWVFDCVTGRRKTVTLEMPVKLLAEEEQTQRSS